MLASVQARMRLESWENVIPRVKAAGVGVAWNFGEWEGRCQRRISPSADAEAKSARSERDFARQ